MPTTTLPDGTRVSCVRRSEAQVLDLHVRGYLAEQPELSEASVIFDVGANIGLFGVRVCQSSPSAKVFAFEPIPEIHAAAQANSETYGPGRFQVFRCGLSATPGEARFTWYPNAPALSTARPEDWEGEPGAFAEAVRGQLQAMPEQMWWARLVPNFLIPAVAWYLTRGAQEVVCPLRTVSEIVDEHGVERIDLLKIDCEGFELDVLRGVRPEHWPLVQRVVTEVHDLDGRVDAVLTLLRDSGLTEQRTEKEAGFEETRMVNVFASRPEGRP